MFESAVEPVPCTIYALLFRLITRLQRGSLMILTTPKTSLYFWL
jgi:hypothetical protein